MQGWCIAGLASRARPGFLLGLMGVWSGQSVQVHYVHRHASSITLFLLQWSWSQSSPKIAFDTVTKQVTGVFCEMEEVSFCGPWCEHPLVIQEDFAIQAVLSQHCPEVPCWGLMWTGCACPKEWVVVLLNNKPPITRTV